MERMVKKEKRMSGIQMEVHCLGHIVSEAGMPTNSDKATAIAGWGASSSLTKLRAFLGLVGCPRQTIELAHKAHMAHTL